MRVAARARNPEFAGQEPRRNPIISISKQNRYSKMLGLYICFKSRYSKRCVRNFRYSKMSVRTFQYPKMYVIFVQYSKIYVRKFQYSKMSVRKFQYSKISDRQIQYSNISARNKSAFPQWL